MNKQALREQILAQLQVELDLQTRAAQLSRDEAISEESRSENRYDMHSQEAAYLAEGQAKLAAEIAASMTLYASLPLPAFDAQAPVAVGAVVGVDAANKRRWYFLGPRGGGLELQLAGRTLLVLTPQSPLGRELLGKRVGDLAKVPGRGAPIAARIAVVE